MHLLLDGSTVTDRAQLHAQLAQLFALPAWYGANLDALYDCLTDLAQDTTLEITAWDTLTCTLGSYAGRLQHVLRAAAAQNPHFTLCIKEADTHG